MNRLFYARYKVVLTDLRQNNMHDILIKNLLLLDKGDLNKIGREIKSVADKYCTWDVVSSKYKVIL